MASASVLDNPVPQPPQVIADLSDTEIVTAFLGSPLLWIKYMRDREAHADELYELATDLQARLDASHELELEAVGPETPASSEPDADSTMTTTRAIPVALSQIWVDVFTVGISGTMPMGPMYVHLPHVNYREAKHR